MIKLCWQDIEPHDTKLGNEWVVRKGATLAIDLDSKSCNLLKTLTNDELVKQRGSMLAKLEETKRLVPGEGEASDQTDKNYLAVVSNNGALQLEGAMRLLHIIGD